MAASSWKRPGRPRLEASARWRSRLLDQRERPQFRVLLRKRNVSAVAVAPGGAARFTVEGEGQQSFNLGFARHQLQEHARKPDGFLGEVAAVLVGALHVIPADSECGVNSVKHSAEPLGQFALL